MRAGLSGDRIPVGPRFSVVVQTVPASHPPYSRMGTGYFSGLKPSASGTAHTLPSDTEVMNGLALTPSPPLCSSKGMSWGDLCLPVDIIIRPAYVTFE